MGSSCCWCHLAPLGSAGLCGFVSSGFWKSLTCLLVLSFFFFFFLFSFFMLLRPGWLSETLSITEVCHHTEQSWCQAQFFPCYKTRNTRWTSWNEANATAGTQCRIIFYYLLRNPLKVNTRPSHSLFTLLPSGISAAVPPDYRAASFRALRTAELTLNTLSLKLAYLVQH